MSIANALNIAYSGLAANSKSAETVSNNVSNALTEGYSRQTVGHSSIVLGGLGVGVGASIATRDVDPLVTEMRRSADANHAQITTIANSMDQLASALGDPGASNALATKFSNFEIALSNAVNAPDSTALQLGILSSTKSLIQSLYQLSAKTNEVREEADAAIAKQVRTVNVSLELIEALNADIRKMTYADRSVAGMEDQRQLLVDQVNRIVPVRSTISDTGEISIYTQAGGVLLNGTPRRLEFSQSTLIAPSMTLTSGALSGIEIEGIPIALSLGGGILAGGSLAANFEIRDNTGPNFRAKLDALAADLISRFQDSTTDPSLNLGDAGLFTDNGSVFDPLNEIGISGRLSINSLVDPSLGGAMWRLRDGINISLQGPAGASDQLLRMVDAMAEIRPATPGLAIATPMNSVGFAEELASMFAFEADDSAKSQATSLGRLSELIATESHSTGVDTDQEMQRLLIIEQSFSANARVVSVLDGLMKQLLEM